MNLSNRNSPLCVILSVAKDLFKEGFNTAHSI